jgi:hypothetical protein
VLGRLGERGFVNGVDQVVTAPTGGSAFFRHSLPF